jgi:hypothetical protein
MTAESSGNDRRLFEVDPGATDFIEGSVTGFIVQGQLAGESDITWHAVTLKEGDDEPAEVWVFGPPGVIDPQTMAIDSAARFIRNNTEGATIIELEGDLGGEEALELLSELGLDGEGEE